MIRLNARLSILALAATLAAAPALSARADDGGGSSSAGDAIAYATVAPSNAFGYALTADLSSAALAKDANQNLLVSPASAAMALQMLLNGAPTSSQTYAEMSKAMDLDKLTITQVDDSNQGLLGYLAALASTPVPAEPFGPTPVPFTFTMANSVWSNSQSTFRFAPAFLSTLKTDYSAVAQSVPFNAQGASTINQWASNETNGKITNIVDAKTLPGLSFVLMNATYFKANWQNRFIADNTRQAPFTSGDGATEDVQMMEAHEFGYAEVAGSQVVELPYEGGQASMYVVLPPAGRSLSDALATTLTPDFWNAVSEAPEQLVDLSLPKFSFSSDLDLVASLRSLGMKTLFTDAADLTAAGNEPVSVSAVKQSTFIQVDEQGTEAAAVTAISAGSAIRPVTPVAKMVVDRPFLTSIVEKKTGAVLFIGIVSKP